MMPWKDHLADCAGRPAHGDQRGADEVAPRDVELAAPHAARRDALRHARAVELDVVRGGRAEAVAAAEGRAARAQRARAERVVRPGGAKRWHTPLFSGCPA